MTDLHLYLGKPGVGTTKHQLQAARRSDRERPEISNDTLQVS